MVKNKAENKMKETFRFYIKNTNLKITLLTQLFRLFSMALEPIDLVPNDQLDREKDREIERERVKRLTNRSKTLTNTLMGIFISFIYENLENTTVRQYTLDNLLPFIKLKQISFEQYFPEYLKQMLDFIGLNHSLNLFDMNFISVVLDNSNFDTKMTFQILDSLLHLFFLSIPQAKFLLICITKLLKKIPPEEPLLIKWCIVTVRLSLNRYITLEKKRRRPLGFLKEIKLDAKDIQFSRNAKELFMEFQLAQRRAMIIELIRGIYFLENEPVNKELKGLLVFANLLFKNILKEKDLGLKKLPNNDAFSSVLCYYGDPDEIIDKEELDAEFKLMKGQNMNNISMTEDDEKESGLNSKNLNYMKQKMSKERMYELAMKKGVKADPAVLKHIKELQDSYKLKQDIKQFKEQEKKEIEAKKKQEVREQVVIKTLGFGVAAFNKKDFDANLLRPLDSVPEAEVDVQLIDMNSYEDHDREAVNSLFKVYGKLFKTYFVTYSSGFKIVDKDTEKIEQTITRSDLWTFLKDKQLDNQTSMDFVGDIIRQINMVHFDVRGDPNNLSYKGYRIFLLEISAKFFPETIPMPPAFSLKRLLKYLEDIDAFDEKIAKIFKNPEYAGVDDYDLIEYLNEQVNKNPNMKIPESYTLNKRKAIDYEFKINKAFAISDSYKACSEILNDLISRCPELGFDFIEPIPHVSDVYYVKPTTFFKDSLGKKLSSSVLMPTSERDSKSVKKKGPKEPHFISEAEKKMMFAKPLVELSTNMKYHVAGYDLKDKALAKDCAYVLEELLQKASEGIEPGAPAYHLKIPVKINIENEITRRQEKSKIASEKRAIKEWEEFKERDTELKAQITAAEEKRIAEEEKKRKEQRKKEKEALAKKKKKEKEAKKKAQKIKKELEKQEQKEKKIKEEREKRAQKRLEEIEKKRKAEFEDFQAIRLNAYKRQWRDKWLEFKKEEARHNYLKETWAENQKIKNSAYLASFKKEKDKLNKKKEQEEQKYFVFKTTPELDLVIKKYHESIQELFSYYCKSGFHEIGHEECGYLMDKGEVARFSSQFGVFPVLSDAYKLNKWYNMVDLKEDISKFGINLDQFKEYLKDVCFKNVDFLSNFYADKLRESDEASFREKSPDGDKQRKSIESFTKRSEANVMPSMRGTVKKTDKISSQNLKEAVEIPPNEKSIGRKGSTMSKKTKGGESALNVSIEEQPNQEEEKKEQKEAEKFMNAFEGLMMYTGIIEDKKEMKERIRQVHYHYKARSPIKKEIEAKKLKETHGMPTEDSRLLYQSRTIRVPKADLIPFQNELFETRSRASAMSARSLSKIKRGADSEINDVTPREYSVNKKGDRSKSPKPQGDKEPSRIEDPGDKTSKSRKSTKRPKA